MNNEQMDNLADRIAKKMAAHPCPLGLTPEEAPRLKGIVKFTETATTTIIKVVITVVVTAALGWVAVGFVQGVMAGNG